MSFFIMVPYCFLDLQRDPNLENYPRTRKGRCTKIVYTLALKHLYMDYFGAKAYAVWVHGPLNPKPL